MAASIHMQAHHSIYHRSSPSHVNHICFHPRRKHPILSRSSNPLSQSDNNTTIDNNEVQESWNLLKEFTQKQARGVAQHMLDSPEDRATLRHALLTVAENPIPSIGWQPSSESAPTTLLLGICSSDIRFALRALRDYTQAFNVPFIQPESRVPGCTTLPSIRCGVFVKYNSMGASYVSAYDGQDRGVLVTLGTEQIGHLPLGLLDEEMNNPLPPSLLR